MREGPENLLNLAKSSTCIFLAAIDQYAHAFGYLVADVLEHFADVPGITSDPYFSQGNTIYIHRVAVHPEWRHNGIGTALINRCVSHAFQTGYERVVIHIPHGANLRMEVRALQSIWNWYDTDRTFDYVEISPNPEVIKEIQSRAGSKGYSTVSN
jgi:ribosomal protein S18 acetylase RimI-like enzyme